MDKFGYFLEGYFKNQKINESLLKAINFYTLFISTRALDYFMKNNPKYYKSAAKTHNKILEHIVKTI